MTRALSIAALAAIACSDPTGPKPKAEITVLVDSVHITTGTGVQPYNRTYTWMRFTVPVTVRNTGTDPITLNWCQPTVVRDSAETASFVWHPLCVSDGDDYTGAPIPPGAERTANYSVDATTSGPGAFADWQSPTVGGAFRIRIDFAVKSTGQPSRALAYGHGDSNLFQVVQTP